MAFSSLIERLIPEGSVLAGNQPKTIVSPTGEPGYYDTSPFGNLLRSVEEFQIRDKMRDEEELKRRKNQSDMYKTLRDAGYEPKKAYDAVIKKQFPEEAGGATLKEQESNATIDKLKAQTETEKARTAKEKAKTEKLKRPAIGTSFPDLRKRIMEKIAAGEDLTPGEQKVYDEVIRKYGQKSDLESILENKVKKIDVVKKDEMVPMTDPIGRKKLVPKVNVEKAKQKGWKLR